MATLALELPPQKPALAHEYTETAIATTTLAVSVDVKQPPSPQPEAEEDMATSMPPPPTDLLLESDSQEPPASRPADESDWRTSSDDAAPARFSLIALPGRVRASLFSRKPRKLKRRKPKSAVATAGGDTASSGSKAPVLSTAVDVAAVVKPPPQLQLPTPDSTLQKPMLATPKSTPKSTPKTTPKTDKSVETFKHFWDEKLRHTMEKLSNLSKTEAGGSSDRPSDVFHLLLQLYAHQDIVEELYSSCVTNAPEFEFYIPQLGTFLLHGNYAKQHQLECFLLARSGESLPFAHRLTWFLRSFADDAKSYQSEYLSVTASPDEENSSLLAAIEQRAGVPALLMNNGLCDEEVSVATPSNLLRRRSSVFAIDTEMDPRVLATDESFAVHLQSKQQLVMYKARPQEGNSHQSSLYQQTPAFVSALTGLADDLIAVPLAQRVSVLRAGLSEIQARVLPSDVLYLPIGNTHHRVKAIHVDECFTFSTKERVPYFLVVEVLEYSDQPKTAMSSSSSLSPTALKRKQRAASVRKATAGVATATATTTGAGTTAATATQRPSSRGFSLMLPFKKSGHTVEPSSTGASPFGMPRGRTGRFSGHTSDSSVSEATPSRLSRLSEGMSERMSERMTDCTDSSSALSMLEAVEQQDEEERLVAAEDPSGANAVAVADSVELAEEASVAVATPENGPSSEPVASPAPATSFFSKFLGSSKKKAALKDVQKKTGSAVAVTMKDPLDGEEGDDEKEEEVVVEEEVKEKEKEEETETAHPIDRLSSTAAASDAPVVAAVVEETDAEKQASEEQKMRMGQWSLPRAGRRKARSNSSASSRSGGQFDTFYSSWFSKKQKHEKDEVCTHPETALHDADAAPAAVDAPVGSSDDDRRADTPEVMPVPSQQQSQGSPSTAVVLSPEPAPAPAPVPAPTASNVVKTSKAKATAAKKRGDDTDTSQDEGGSRRKRDRDLSLSLDFTDSNAWKVKFDLEDGLSDNEREGSDSEPEEKKKKASATPANSGDQEQEEEEEEEAPIIVFRERWSEKEARLRKTSQFSDHPGWRLLSVIVKSNDDLRQEQFAAQLIAQCDRIFKEYSLPLRLRPYNVIATSATTGLIEAVPDTVSLDSLKRNDPDYTTLLDFYCRLHGDAESLGFARARRHFVESLAAYSMVCYVFQIKDRHNGNILVDTQGHIIHIDFGFLLTNSPGSNLNFEKAPFKLTDEFVELMGGPRSSTFRYFRSLCIRAFLALQRNMDKIVLLVEMMLVGNADLPCFAGGKRAVIEGLRARLRPGERSSACQLFVNQLIDQSINNWRTRWYDKYQRACLGIL